MRSLAREIVFKFIFSRLFNPSDEGLFDVLCKELDATNKNFAIKLLEAINKGETEYLSNIESLAIGYKLNRVFNVDKCALLIGMAELNAFPDTPFPVVIDEAVKLVAKFSSENSTNFVNGILAEYVRSVGYGKNN
jgi:N utilization substance protein B